MLKPFQTVYLFAKSLDSAFLLPHHLIALWLTSFFNESFNAFIWAGFKTRDSTHRILCALERILCLARRRPETVWQSWCTEGRFESQNSQFSFSNGNMLSSLHIRLRGKETNRKRWRDTDRVMIINILVPRSEQHKEKYLKIDALMFEH